ncbi:hypothetical protein KPL70_020956 [Citrus sinensis]|uniref:Uncharacterized protein n=1 Tax=Citrus clementina TaxID=85681 RepID=V4SUC4_CITCL|nr:putative UPF0481 protein At3g02645 [Citrus x clementina]ESR40751.1 hypothetical protein CICLE_v10027595mg [Citrus x clementina]KAH9667243.1 hypothetical protein KPL70_020956 [Citrus sinensis]
MSSNPNPNPNPNPTFDEHRWIINIRRTLEEELETDTDIPVCIFSVPKTLMFSDPDSYTPQEVAIGPYHYWRPELYEMERYKLAAAKRAQRHIDGDHKFQYIVDQLKELELKIRACYHKFLNFSNETLAWMMAIDASFLLEFLQIYAVKEAKLSATYSSTSMSHLLDYAGTKAAHNTILRDMVMLENQIPLFVLRKMLEVQYSSLESADDMLQAMLMGFCEELSPFKLMKDMPMIDVSECAHLLDFLYDTIVPKVEQKSEISEVVEDQGDDEKPKERYTGGSTYVKKIFGEIWKLLSKLNKGPILFIKKLLVSKPVKFFFKLPFTMLSKLPGFSMLAQPIQYLIFPQDNDDKKSDDESSHTSNNLNKPPLVEEIIIPSVTELAKSQVHFLPTAGNISTLRFDRKTATLHLPTISFDINTEVILRNLVAYEASNASGPLVFTRYTELMNGIIDTEEDVKLLREKGIILNRLKSDAEITNLWNGMSKSIRLTKVPHIDKVIEGVNKHYNSQWKVKFRKSMKHYVFGSWQFLTLLATIMLLLLMTLQAFCSVYNCRKFKFVSDSD